MATNGANKKQKSFEQTLWGAANKRQGLDERG